MTTETDMQAIAAYAHNFRVEATALCSRATGNELSPAALFIALIELCRKYDSKLDVWTRSINTELHRLGKQTPFTTQLTEAVAAARVQLRAAALALVAPP